jgi:putative copper export protein
VRLLQLSLVTLHVLAAAAWFGAMVFVAASLVPALRRRAAVERAEIIAATGRRLRRLIWVLFGVLTATGVAQLGFRGHTWSDVAGPMWEGSAGRALAVKLALFAAALTVAAWHDFRIGPRAVEPRAAAAGRESSRRLASWAGRLSLLLAAGILAAAVTYVRGGIRPY